MTFTAHGTKDICKYCGKEIIYDADDGYWAWFFKKQSGKGTFNR